MYVTIFVVALVAAIMFHEFGHFASAKAFGMKVERFFLGFGPTLWSFQRGETEYGVKLVPAGGFVKIVGMTPFEEADPADRGRLFYEQPAWQRAIVLAMGSATHFLVAAGLVFVVLSFFDMPWRPNTVADVVDGAPADEAGLRPGDAIVAVDGRTTDSFPEVVEALIDRGGETVPLTVERADERIDVTVELAATDPEGVERGFLGVEAPPVEMRSMSAGEALVGVFSGDMSVPELTRLNLEGLAQAFSPSGISAWLGQLDDEGPRSPEGPMSLVGAGQIVNTLGDQGNVAAILVALASLNIVIGTLNMFPLPPLDGGHLAVLGVEEAVNRLRGLFRRGDTAVGTVARQDAWRIDPSVLTPVALGVILLMVTVFVTALYIDIVRPASELLQ